MTAPPVAPLASMSNGAASSGISGETLGVLDDALVLTHAGGNALRVLVDVLPGAAKRVETASHDLTARFKNLAQSSSKQSDMVEALLATIGSITVEDRHVTLEEFVSLFSTTLDDSVSKMLGVSKKGKRAVKALVMRG